MDGTMISIIIPVYNVEKYIRNTLRSVIEQTYKNLEIILVDDGSSDASAAIALEVLKDFSDIHYHLIQQTNKGQGEARNEGVRHARGEWIFFLDSDDILQPDAVERFVQAGIKENCDFVFSDFQMVSIEELNKKPDYIKKQIIYTGQELQYQFLLRKKKVLVPGTLYKRAWYEEQKLSFENIRFSEDLYFLWQAIAAAEKVVNIQIPLYNYLVRPNSIMTGSRYEKMVEGYQKFKELDTSFQDDKRIDERVKYFMLSRWVLGTMRAGGCILDWESFRQLSRQMDVKRHCRNLLRFPEWKAKVTAAIALINLKAYYSLCKRLGK